MNSVLAPPQIYSCAVDSFLEVSSHVLLPYLSNVPLRNEFTELLFKACSQYVSSNGSSRLLGQIREPVWRYLGQKCSTFTARDCNACFSQSFEEKTFGKLNADERNIFSSSRTFQSFCQTCCRDVTLNSTILLNFVDQSALQKHGLHYSSWPQYISTVQTEPGKLACPDCKNPTCKPLLTSVAQSTFLFTEFSTELINVVPIFDQINVGETKYRLKAMVRCHNNHFTCAILIAEKWTYFDDLISNVKEFANLNSLKSQFPQGWFFTIFESCNSVDIVNKSQPSHTEEVFVQIPRKKRKRNINTNASSTPINVCSNNFEIFATDEGFNDKINSDQVYINKDADSCAKANAQEPLVTKFKRKGSRKKETCKRTKLISEGSEKNSERTIGKSQQEEAAEVKPKNEDNNNNNCTAGVESQQFNESDDELAFDDESLDPSGIEISCARAPQSNTILLHKGLFESMDKFHKSMQLTMYQCNVCSEAWPLKAKPKNYPDYTCSRCSRDKCVPKKFSSANSMIPSPVPKSCKD